MSEKILLLFADDCREIRLIKFYPPDNGRYLDGHVFLNLSIGIITDNVKNNVFWRVNVFLSTLVHQVMINSFAN